MGPGNLSHPFFPNQGQELVPNILGTGHTGSDSLQTYSWVDSSVLSNTFWSLHFMLQKS